MTIVARPANPGKFIDDFFRDGLEAALSRNVAVLEEADNIVCGGDCGEIPPPSNEKYETDPQVKKQLSMRSGGLIAEMLKSEQYNWWSRK